MGVVGGLMTVIVKQLGGCKIWLCNIETANTILYFMKLNYITFIILSSLFIPGTIASAG